MVGRSGEMLLALQGKMQFFAIFLMSHQSALRAYRNHLFVEY